MYLILELYTLNISRSLVSGNILKLKTSLGKQTNRFYWYQLTCRCHHHLIVTMAQDSIRHTTQTHQLKRVSNFVKMKLLHSQSSFSAKEWNTEAEDHQKNNFSLQGKGDHFNDGLGNPRLKLFQDCSHVVYSHFIIFMSSSHKTKYSLTEFLPLHLKFSTLKWCFLMYCLRY